MVVAAAAAAAMAVVIMMMMTIALLIARSELYTKNDESRIARQNILASWPSVCAIDWRPAEGDTWTGCVTRGRIRRGPQSA